MIYNFVFYFILRVNGFCNGILRLLVKIGTRYREVVFIFEKRSISDAGKKARDLSEKVSTSEERKKGEREKKKKICKDLLCKGYVLLFRFSSVSLREDSRSGRKEGNNLCFEFPSFRVERNNTLKSPLVYRV